MSKHLVPCLTMSLYSHRVSSLILENQWGGRGGTRQSRKTRNTDLTILPPVWPCTDQGTCVFLSIGPDGAAGGGSSAGLSNHAPKNETTSPVENPGGCITLPVSFQHQHDHMLHAACPGDDAAVPLDLYQNVGRLRDNHNSL